VIVRSKVFRVSKVSKDSKAPKAPKAPKALKALKDLIEFSIAIINTLYTCRHRCKYFIRNRVEPFGETVNGQIASEYLHAVALLAVDVRNIYHAYIHADVSYIFCLFAVDEAVAVAVAKLAV
jgi:hypothetical protein